MGMGLSLRGPPPGMDMNHHHRGLPPPGLQQQHHGRPGGGIDWMQQQQQPAPHVNPAFFPPPPGMGPAGLPPPGFPPPIMGQPPPFIAAGGGGVAGSAGAGSVEQQAPPAVSEAEFEEVMGRNRTVSSSAIARAVADASIGDYGSAIETLVTAISLIKQSKVAHDERCKILVSSLQDTLHGIEAKSYGSRRDRSR